MKRFPRLIVPALVLGLLFGAAGRAQADKLSGKVKNVSPDKMEVVVTDKANKDWTFVVGPTAKVMLDGKPVKLKDLKASDGADVIYVKKEAQLEASEILAKRESKTAESRVPRVGNERTVNGKVKSITIEKSEFVITDAAGKDWTFHLGANAKILMEGKPGQFKDLIVANIVAVQCHQQGSQWVSTEIQVRQQKEKKPGGKQSIRAPAFQPA